MKYCFQCEHNKIENFDKEYLSNSNQTVDCKRGYPNTHSSFNAESCKDFIPKQFQHKVCAMCNNKNLSAERCKYKTGMFFQDSSVPFGSHCETENKWAEKCEGFKFDEIYEGKVNFAQMYEQNWTETKPKKKPKKEGEYEIQVLKSMAYDSDAKYLGDEYFRARIPAKDLIRFHIDRSVIREREEYIAVDLNIKFLLEIIKQLVVK